MFSVEEKLKFQSETFFPSTESHKVQLYATSNLQLEIKDHTQDALELMQLSLDILKMEVELESDSHQDPERLFPEIAEQLLELLLVEAEMKNLL